ncbi:MAG: hypothetical protein PHN26_04305, partial [Eubacteriaceae bacterium]|nr:hypothetical protein [Eubacteriaceae bacterium]
KNKTKKYLKIKNTKTITIPARETDTNVLEIDKEHFESSNRNITKSMAIDYIKNARYSVEVWDGEFERFFSDDGAAYVNIKKNTIRTAFQEEMFTDNVRKSLEVMKND